MQFPYPRKSSDVNVNPSTRYTPRSSSLRNRRTLRRYAPYLLGGAVLFFFLLHLFKSPSSSSTTRRPKPPPGTPSVVLVTPLDPSISASYKSNIIDNRRDYASRHNYATFFPNTTDYDLGSAPSSWSTIPSLRHAMTLHPHAEWLFYLTPTALIMNPAQDLHSKILNPRVLEEHMIVDKPVVPPDSVIKTFTHLSGERVDFILSQDHEGLAGGSLLIRTGDWAKFFLDAWFDPLYRSYNFQKAEGHALEHIVQWHGTVLAKLALVPQRLVNAYAGFGVKGADGVYQEGDFVANFHSCQRDETRSCEEEMAPLMTRWRELRDGERRR